MSPVATRRFWPVLAYLRRPVEDGVFFSSLFLGDGGPLFEVWPLLVLRRLLLPVDHTTRESSKGVHATMKKVEDPK